MYKIVRPWASLAEVPPVFFEILKWINWLAGLHGTGIKLANGGKREKKTDY